MSDLNLDDLERLLAAATPGPWGVAKDGKDARIEVIHQSARTMIAELLWRESGNAIPDALLVVAAVSALPTLLAAVRAHEGASGTGGSPEGGQDG